MKKFLIAIVIGFSLIQCKKDAPTIDSQTEITFNTSFDEIAKTLPSLQQEKLKEALFLLFEYDTKDGSEDVRWSQVRRLLDDKTADDIFTMAEQVAKENSISWNRNQAPYPGGIPKAEHKPMEGEVDENVSLAVELSNIPNGIKIFPSILDDKGVAINNQENLSATVDVLSNSELLYTQKFSIPAQSYDLMSSFDGFNLSFDKLDPTKITSNMLDVLVRIPHPSRYLTLRKKIRIPDQYVQGTVVNPNDSLSLNPIDAPIVKTNALASRFIQNVLKGNLSGAYAISRLSNYGTFQAFSEDKNISKLANGKVVSNAITNSSDNRVEVEAVLADNSGTSNNYKIVVEKINNRWFVTSFE